MKNTAEIQYTRKSEIISKVKRFEHGINSTEKPICHQNNSVGFHKKSEKSFQPFLKSPNGSQVNARQTQISNKCNVHFISTIGNTPLTQI